MKFFLFACAAALQQTFMAPDLAENVSDVKKIEHEVINSASFQQHLKAAMPTFCGKVKRQESCQQYLGKVMFCLEFAKKKASFAAISGVKDQSKECAEIDQKMPALSLFMRSFAFLSTNTLTVPKDNGPKKSPGAPRSPQAQHLAQEMTHDLETNFNKIAPFGKEDTAKELQDHASKTQDTLVDAVENAEVAEIKRSVFRALTRLRAAAIKEFDTIARLETQAIDAYNDAHHYRGENPLAHMHEDEAPVETDKLKSFH